MESLALPLERGAVELTLRSPLRRAAQPPHASSAQSLSPRGALARERALVRRVSSYHDSISVSIDHGGGGKDAVRKHRLGSFASGEYSRSGSLASQTSFRDATSFRKSKPSDSLLGGTNNDHWMEAGSRRALNVLVNLTSGVIAFLLSSTLAVSCGSVLVGHATPLSVYGAHFIDMNLLGTAVLCVVLAWQSQAPWTLGAIDVFVAPIMATMGRKITTHLDGDMELVVPTTMVMVAMTSMILGVVFFTMGYFRVTSIANYMPYPVIAGFLSGIGAELMKNGIHTAASHAFSMQFFTLEQQLLMFPAIAFAAVARFGQYMKWPVAISFPVLLVISVAGFHIIAAAAGKTLSDLKQADWVFSWSSEMIRGTPMWFPWANIDFGKVQWRTLTNECFGYFISLIILGAMKYSVSTTSLSTLFGREISPDNEMIVIGVGNFIAGAMGCCGGCHYLSAMGIMKQFEAHERVPALVCAGFLVVLWIQGIRSLQYVPKFVFGGLILSVGLHFLEAYFFSPFRFLKKFEKAIVVLITVSFLVVGMLESVALGIVISMIEMIYRIHKVGCVHHETTGALSRSSVDRTPEQSAYLDAHGNAIFVLRLQGYLFFGTSVNILERIETRVQSLHAPKLQFLVIDFGLVPSFDATALLNFRKVSMFADQYMFDVYFCGVKPAIDRALHRNETYSKRVHFLKGDVDNALETCENALLPTELMIHITGTLADWKRMKQLELWEHFISMYDDDEHVKKLLPLAAYLDVQFIAKDSLLSAVVLRTDTYFICFGYMNVMTDSEFSSGSNIPGVLSGKGVNQDDEPPTRRRKMSLIVPTEEAQWTPFTTEQSRLRKIGPGSIITPDVNAGNAFARYIATSDCVLLRLSAQGMEMLEDRAPHTAVEVLRLINAQLTSNFLHSNKRVSQMSSLLYK